MPFDDRTSDGALAVRSLSEQLRDLEAQLRPDPGQDSDLSLPRIARRSTLPTHLGRPIGLTRPEGFPRIARLNADVDSGGHPQDPALSRGTAFRRGATAVGVGLFLLAVTAIVPPLFLRHPLPAATAPPVPDQLVTPQRTERFAQSAHELRHAVAGATATPPRVQPAVLQVQPAAAPEPAPSRPTITLAVSKNEAARVDLPTIVTGLGSASAGSAVVIDGLPVGARVSHGIPIARDSWTVARADVESAVVFLPRNTPERVGLLVRVIAADSQELAANSLEIRVLRTADVTAPALPAGDTTAQQRPPQPTAHFEPTAAEGEGASDALSLLPPYKR